MPLPYVRVYRGYAANSPNPARRVKIRASSFSRLEKEAFRGFLSFPAFTCFACHSPHLQIFVNKICVHCRMQTLLMPVTYAREH